VAARVDCGVVIVVDVTFAHRCPVRWQLGVTTRNQIVMTTSSFSAGRVLIADVDVDGGCVRG
jgi:hypothetical protein